MEFFPTPPFIPTPRLLSFGIFPTPRLFQPHVYYRPESKQHQQFIHSRKLNVLLAEYLKSGIDPDSVIFNYCNYVLNSIERKVLSRGLRFSIYPHRLDYFSFLTPFEELARVAYNLRLLLRNISILIILKLSLKIVLFLCITPGVLYGLSKAHKDNCPTRPILSTLSTYNHKLAKFLAPLLQSLTTNQFTVTYSFSFVKEISSLPNHSFYMSSFDVSSLFTNVPLDDVIDSSTNLTLMDRGTVNYNGCNFDRCNFKKNFLCLL